MIGNEISWDFMRFHEISRDFMNEWMNEQIYFALQQSAWEPSPFAEASGDSPDHSPYNNNTITEWQLHDNMDRSPNIPLESQWPHERDFSLVTHSLIYIFPRQLHSIP